MIVYRMADARHPIFDATGAMVHGGRWNSVGVSAIYAAETYSGALLEVLVHANLSQPPKHHRLVRIEVPSGLKIETITVATVQGWDDEDMSASRNFGDRWIQESRCSVLRVPSVITQGRENNVVFNPAHPDFALIRAGEPELIFWAARLFGR